MKKKPFLLFFGIVSVLLLQSCFLLTEAMTQQGKPQSAPALKAGSIIGGKTIVWVNNQSGAWTFLAVGTPSGPIQWSNDSSKYMSTKSMTTSIGGGKANTLSIASQHNSHAHTISNNAAKYCLSKGGYLPTTEEAEKIALFIRKNFWTSNWEATSKALYYSPSSNSTVVVFRDEGNTAVAVPVYYLDASGNVVEP
ncbi:hypothetical protein [Treponema pedis]|uniref:hypothetical protein n=1 Tax=Treponema pedis TaxID=409322 RepID=UPI000463DAAA|nr:hypothetical protein [Treponema pedis]